MRTIVIIVLAIVMFLVTCVAQARAEWTKQDTAMEMVYLGVNAADLASTWSVTDRNSGTHEVNPIIGANPTPARLVGTFLVTTVVHYAVMRVLPDDLRAIAWNGSINLKAAMFKHNYMVDDGYSNPKWEVAMQFKF